MIEPRWGFGGLDSNHQGSSDVRAEKCGDNLDNLNQSRMINITIHVTI